MTMYRLIFSNGCYGAWFEDYEIVKKKAEFYNARIESKVFKRRG